MGWFSGFVVFLIVWWLVLLMVLPWGVRPPDDPEVGHEAGAPESPRIKQKMLITTGVAILVWLLIFGFVELNLFSFREAVKGWW
jgi:predicted secreted protein